ncbi:MAG: ribosome biogenesis protein [Candidatus Heimdallarchaeota archaeon]|nr:ribosome biogenesis protein [Candidatus Heimdallarchaeota archaeon]
MSLHKCLNCGTYTFKENCPKCNGKAVPPAPAKFSIEHAQKYAKYRIAFKKQIEETEAQNKSN